MQVRRPDSSVTSVSEHDDMQCNAVYSRVLIVSVLFLPLQPLCSRTKVSLVEFGLSGSRLAGNHPSRGVAFAIKAIHILITAFTPPIP